MEQTNVETQERPKTIVKINAKGLEFSRLLTKPDIHPYDEIEWETRTARITDDKGDTVFELVGAEVPKSWSQLATNVVASKYFRSSPRIGDRETSVRQMIDRVVGAITERGRDGGYFRSDRDTLTFADELTHILVNQMASFNSPVWFNVGIEEHPMASACFINSVSDSMESIMELAAVEANLFKGGSGSGTNLSTLRSSREKLSSGGRPSGPTSFMRGYDAFAGVIKSGGKTRRAAVMRI
ncbi:MAG: vitamin B12-dependent ribonucleotide reductase, partial [Deltaproteobacteria bacterium]|nr:vitamin B12-dependent ribonucleotide reductase [Deltaproteobacteria bacterium]